MHYPHLRNDRFPRTEPYEGVSSRMTTHRSLKAVKYSPYTPADEEKAPTHVITKVTSKINGIFKGLQSAVGSFFKSAPADLKESVSSENNLRKSALSYPNVSNQAIKNIDFQGLAGLLAPTNPMSTSFGGQQAEVNPMEVSFGDDGKNQTNSSGNQTVFTFKPTVANLSDSRIVEALDLNGSSVLEQEPKMNVLRILSFCHGLYEHTKERYSKAKPYGVSLRTVLTKGLPKPIPLRSTTPLIEFKYNKVSGKFEAHSSFKKKKRTAHEADPDFDLKQHMVQSVSMMSEDRNVPEQHTYKKKRVSNLAKAGTEDTIHVDLKKSKKKLQAATAPSSKKAASYGNTLETYETDETEEHELKKESPYKNKVFEEDKEDYFAKAEESRKSNKLSPVKGKDSVTSKADTVASTNPFTSPIKSQKTTPEKIDTTKQQNEKYQSLKITPPIQKQITDDEVQKDADAENILNLPKTPTFLNNKNPLLNSSKSEESSIEQAPAEVAATTEVTENKPLFSGGLFSNLNNNNRIIPAVAAPENNEVPQNMSFSDEQPQVQAQPQIVAPAAPIQQQEQPKVIPDFLKAYQRTGSVSSTANVDTNNNNNASSNPFLSRAASTVTDTSNPFLKPAKTEAPMMSFLGNNNITVTSPQSNQNAALPAVTSTLGLFNNINNNNSSNSNSTANSLFGNSGMSFTQNSPAPSLLDVNSNSNGGSIFLKSSENSNGFDNSGGNIFHNNFQNNNGMEKESSIGFQSNLFSNNSVNEQKSNNLFSNNFGGGNSLFSNNNGMNNNISNTNSLFASNNSSQQTNTGIGMGMWNNNNSPSASNNFLNNNNNNNSPSNNFLNNSSNNQSTINPFLNTNNNSSSNNAFLSPPQSNKNPFTGGNMGGQQNQQAASNFLGIGSSSSPAPTQERVFRKIIMPGSGNKKERAF